MAIVKTLALGAWVVVKTRKGRQHRENRVRDIDVFQDLPRVDRFALVAMWCTVHVGRSVSETYHTEGGVDAGGYRGSFSSA